MEDAFFVGSLRTAPRLNSRCMALFSSSGMSKSSFGDLVNSAAAEGVPFAIGIITRTTGSSPQRQGAKAIFFADGRILGTLGGGCLEAEVQDRARRALQSGEPAEFHLVLDHDFGWDDGLICGGAVHGLILPKAAEAVDMWRALSRAEHGIAWGVREDFKIALAPAADAAGWKYRETVQRSFALWIAGSGHVAHALAPLAAGLDFEVTVFDDRPALLTRERFPDAAMLAGAWQELLATPLPAEPCFGAIMTRGHQHDALVLSHWIQRPFAFLAMLGSRRKRRVLFEGLAAAGIGTPEQHASVACPAGVDIDAVSVQEIALSIAAQLVQKRAEIRRLATP